MNIQQAIKSEGSTYISRNTPLDQKTTLCCTPTDGQWTLHCRHRKGLSLQAGLSGGYVCYLYRVNRLLNLTLMPCAAHSNRQVILKLADYQFFWGPIDLFPILTN